MSEEGDCNRCIFEICENRRLIEQQSNGMEKLAQILDRRVGDLIEILREKQNSPYTVFNRLILVVGVMFGAGFVYVFLHEFGVDTVRALAEVWQKV